MKISKSFKITTLIFIGFLFVNNPFAHTELPSNLVIHDKPKKITNIIFKDNNLQEVDLSEKKRQDHGVEFLGYLVCSM